MQLRSIGFLFLFLTFLLFVSIQMFLHFPVEITGSTVNILSHSDQKPHWARSHHFDFRLEKDGVFKSWAVPKGFPERPGLKRLAVQVEDHVLEFAPFHESNLEGESAKGRIRLWDHGTYELEQWTEDRIDFNLHGSKVSGKFSFFRFKESEPLSWFLIKRRST